MSGPTEACAGLETGDVSIEEFRHFAARFGTSSEIGPIGTYFDTAKDKQTAEKVLIVGLRACTELIAVACFTLTRSREGQSFSCKLDSVIVKPSLRRQGLASLLVAHGFRRLFQENGESIAMIYAHSVHPATVKLLRRHDFSDPNPIGAPISALAVDESNRAAFLTGLRNSEQGTMTRLKHKCVRCVNRKKGAVAWCRQPKR